MLHMEEVLTVNVPAMSIVEKDVEWKIDEKEFIVRNVPHIEYEDEEDVYFDSGVSITLTALRDLMVEGEIPCDVNFKKFEHIEFPF